MRMRGNMRWYGELYRPEGVGKKQRIRIHKAQVERNE